MHLNRYVGMPMRLLLAVLFFLPLLAQAQDDGGFVVKKWRPDTLGPAAEKFLLIGIGSGYGFSTWKHQVKGVHQYADVVENVEIDRDCAALSFVVNGGFFGYAKRGVCYTIECLQIGILRQVSITASPIWKHRKQQHIAAFAGQRPGKTAKSGDPEIIKACTFSTRKPCRLCRAFCFHTRLSFRLQIPNSNRKPAG